MKCPFLRFEAECVGGECPLFAEAPPPTSAQAQSMPGQPVCGLSVLTRFLFVYRRDRGRLLEQIDQLGQRIARKIDEHDAHLRHRY